MVVGIRITPHARAMSRDYSDWATGTTGEEWKGLMRWVGCIDGQLRFAASLAGRVRYHGAQPVASAGWNSNDLIETYAGLEHLLSLGQGNAVDRHHRVGGVDDGAVVAIKHGGEFKRAAAVRPVVCLRRALCSSTG